MNFALVNTILPNYFIDDLIELHRQRFEWTHNPESILNRFTRLSDADDDFNPVCLRNKAWIFMKEDFEEAMEEQLSR